MRRKVNTPALISPAAAARKLGIDVRRVRIAIQREQLPSVAIGSRKLIPVAAVERLIANY
jgi:hypothetical protein